MNKNINHRNERDVWTFFILTFAYSWPLWLPFVLVGLGVLKSSETLAALWMPALFIGAFAPLFSAVTMIAKNNGRSGIKKYMLQVFDLHVRARYLIFAVVLPLIITAAAHYIANLTGIDNLPNSFLPDNLPVPTIILAIPYFLVMLIIGGGQEEFGWRGYAQEPLQERFGVIGGSLVLGMIWGVWHLPLWFVPQDGHSYYSFLAFLVYTMSTAVIMGWLYNASDKKLVIPWVMHAMGNTVAPLFPIMHMEKVPQPGYLLWAGLNCITALGITIWYLNKHKDAVVKRDNYESLHT